MPDDACCSMMTGQLEHACELHARPVDCPDVLVVRLPTGRYLMPIRDGGTGALPIDYCPWCGELLGLYA